MILDPITEAAEAKLTMPTLFDLARYDGVIVDDDGAA
jgi:hypothetical protein